MSYSDSIVCCVNQPANSGLFCKHAQAAELQYLTQYATLSSEKRAKQDAGGRLHDMMYTWVHASWHLQTWQDSLKGGRILLPLLQDLAKVPMQPPLVSDSTGDSKFGKTRRRRFKSRGEVSCKSHSAAHPPKKGRLTILRQAHMQTIAYADNISYLLCNAVMV